MSKLGMFLETLPQSWVDFIMEKRELSAIKMINEVHF